MQLAKPEPIRYHSLYEEFDDDHSDVDYRMDASPPHPRLQALDVATASR